MTTDAEVSAVLRRAADLCALGWFAIASDGQRVAACATGYEGKRHCALTAILDASNGARCYEAAEERLAQHLDIHTEDIARWNDSQPGPEPVIAALRAAAEEA